MLLRLIFLLLTLTISMPIRSQPTVLKAESSLDVKSKLAAERCAKKAPTVSEDQAISIAKAEVLKRIGEKAAKDFTRYEAYIPTSKLYANEYWYVFTMPDTREIDAHISIRLNRCGKLLIFKQGV